MADAKYDVLGIGNAIFDVLVQTDEAFLGRHGMTKGGMALIDEARATAIYADMGPATEMSGGSAANTIVGIANLGARAAYVGKVRDDQIGGLYTHDIRAAGVAFETKAASGGPATGCSYILVTPDGERTMNTYLGAAQELMPDDIDAAQIEASSIIYLEGYLWDPEERQGSLRQGGDHRAWRRPSGRADLVGFVLRRPLPRRVSRPDAQGHRRSGVRQRGRAAIPVRNSGFRCRAKTAARRHQTRHRHPQREGLRRGVQRRRRRGAGLPDSKLVDTTGAGDLFAAGFLFGLVRNAGHENSGRLGALAAAEVIQHIGARPQVSLKELAQKNGLPV